MAEAANAGRRSSTGSVCSESSGVLEPPDSEDEEHESGDESVDTDSAVVEPDEVQCDNLTLKESSKKAGKWFLYHHELQDSRWLKRTPSEISDSCTGFALGNYEGVMYVFPKNSKLMMKDLKPLCETVMPLI